MNTTRKQVVWSKTSCKTWVLSTKILLYWPFSVVLHDKLMKTQPKRASRLRPETEQMFKWNNKDFLVAENLTHIYCENWVIPLKECIVLQIKGSQPFWVSKYLGTVRTWNAEGREEVAAQFTGKRWGTWCCMGHSHCCSYTHFCSETFWLPVSTIPGQVLVLTGTCASSCEELCVYKRHEFLTNALEKDRHSRFLSTLCD